MAKAFDPEINAALRALAREEIRARGIAQGELAATAGVTPGYMSDFLNGNRGAGLRLLRGLGRAAPLKLLELLDVDPGTVLALWSANGSREELQMGSVPESVRRAARAAIELLGCGPDEAARAAQQAFAEHGEVPGSDPEWWLGKIRGYLPVRRGSGVRPSSRAPEKQKRKG